MRCRWGGQRSDEAGARPDAHGSLLPYFKRAETFSGGASAWRGGNGPLLVLSLADVTDRNPVALAFITAAQDLGFPATPDVGPTPKWTGCPCRKLTVNRSYVVRSPPHSAYEVRLILGVLAPDRLRLLDLADRRFDGSNSSIVGVVVNRGYTHRLKLLPFVTIPADGVAGERNPVEARHWLERAIAQGIHDAVADLAQLTPRLEQ
jgi:hypothetical protein